MKIHQTRNYGLFTAHTSNRPITEERRRKLAQIRDSMKEYGFLPYPILVKRTGEKLAIEDGQGRFQEAKALGLPVLYVENTRDDVDLQRVQAGQSSWSQRDCVATHAAKGQQDFNELLAFARVHHLPLGVSSGLLTGGASGANVSEKVRDGSFRVTDREFAAAVASILSALSARAGWARKSIVVQSVARLVRVKEFNASQFIRRIEAHPHLLRYLPTVDAQTDNFEEVYNYASKSGRIPLSFLVREEMSARMPASIRNKK